MRCAKAKVFCSNSTLQEGSLPGSNSNGANHTGLSATNTSSDSTAPTSLSADASDLSDSMMNKHAGGIGSGAPALYTKEFAQVIDQPLPSSTEGRYQRLADLYSGLKGVRGAIADIESKTMTVAASSAPGLVDNAEFDDFDRAMLMGLYSYEELTQLYASYCHELSYIVPFGDRTPFEECRRQVPLLLLTSVTCATVNSKSEKTDERVLYLEQVLTKTVFADAKLTVETLLALLTFCVYSRSKAGRQSSFMLFLSMSISMQLDLGNEEDCRILEDAYENPQAFGLPPSAGSETWKPLFADMSNFVKAKEKSLNLEQPTYSKTIGSMNDVYTAFLRVRTYLVLCQAVGGMVINSGRVRFFSMIENCRRCLEVMAPLASKYEMALICLIKIMYCFDEAHQFLLQSTETFNEDLRRYEVAAQTMMNYLSEFQSASLATGFTYLQMIPMKSSYEVMIQSLNEVLLNKIIAEEYAYYENPTDWPKEARIEPTLKHRFALKIQQYSFRLIDDFCTLNESHMPFPVFIYFRPLHALTSLIRLWVVSWTFGWKMSIDLDGCYSQVEAAWKKNKRMALPDNNLYNNLLRIKNWIATVHRNSALPDARSMTTMMENMNITPQDLNGPVTDSRAILFKFFKSVVLNKEGDVSAADNAAGKRRRAAGEDGSISSSNLGDSTTHQSSIGPTSTHTSGVTPPNMFGSAVPPQLTQPQMHSQTHMMTQPPLHQGGHVPLTGLSDQQTLPYGHMSCGVNPMNQQQQQQQQMQNSAGAGGMLHDGGLPKQKMLRTDQRAMDTYNDIFQGQLFDAPQDVDSMMRVLFENQQS